MCSWGSLATEWQQLGSAEGSLQPGAPVCSIILSSLVETENEFNWLCAVVAQVAEEDLQRVAMATGAQVQTTVYNLDPRVLGTCTQFQERQVGAERYNLFTGGCGGRCSL